MALDVAIASKTEKMKNKQFHTAIEILTDILKQT